MKTCNLIALSVITALSHTSYANDFTNTLSQALKESNLSADFRYRLEYVDQDNLLDEAIGSTLKSRLNIQSGTVSGFSGFIQLDNVSLIGNDHYNSTVNGNNQYSVIADPKGTDINQAFIRYKSTAGTTFTAGRQQVNHLNQRFLGGVAWRQNEQTFDGYRLQHNFKQNISAEIGHFYNINRIFGPKGAAADQDGSFNTALINWQLHPQHKLSAYGYDLDFSNWAARSSITLGIDYQGSISQVPNLSWHLALAQQQDQHNAAIDYKHHYHRVSVNWQQQHFNVQAGQERLAGNGTSAFQTPLATLHAFHGFTDTFLNTPNTGLRDHWLQLSVPVQAVKLNLAWHRFDSDAGNQHYGDEWNLSASYKFGNGLASLIKLAHYDANDFAVDTTKVWFMLSYHLE
ncbi:alginate export family protein [Rheinheimera sp. WS51]|uniref:alginate export family protein n=1 Tax=Rheinheimera sp. WS51 TaxID=3425886 RepID=UPI003D9066DE